MQPIVNQTAYTFDVLYAFNKRHLSFWRPLFIVLFSVVNVLMLLVLVMACISGQIEATTVIIAAAVLVIGITRLLQYTVLLSRNIRKQVKDVVCRITFTEEGLDEVAHSEMTGLHSESHIPYKEILKVTESASAYYLYIRRNAAHIITKDGFVEGTEAAFLMLLREKIEAKKLKI